MENCADICFSNEDTQGLGRAILFGLGLNGGLVASRQSPLIRLVTVAGRSWPGEKGSKNDDRRRLAIRDPRLGNGDRLAAGDWRLATGDWRLATGDWRLVTGDWRLATDGHRLGNCDPWRLATDDIRKAKAKDESSGRLRQQMASDKRLTMSEGRPARGERELAVEFRLATDKRQKAKGERRKAKVGNRCDPVGTDDRRLGIGTKSLRYRVRADWRQHPTSDIRCALKGERRPGTWDGWLAAEEGVTRLMTESLLIDGGRNLWYMILVDDWRLATGRRWLVASRLSPFAFRFMYIVSRQPSFASRQPPAVAIPQSVTVGRQPPLVAPHQIIHLLLVAFRPFAFRIPSVAGRRSPVASSQLPAGHHSPIADRGLPAASCHPHQIGRRSQRPATVTRRMRGDW
ncbi:hypothetical protein M407DRAFT_11368 [Tulasnella calospora MUT 4182]|uniref:Uncharacterized protein n=1 Tax=Tulasnella calospora MUT 4182 TaxID=1051891 RepID=A0A0C3KDI5_9AGAM|nr:hypothetical protein M407DRAFT_11368 [Tulasnella calospora MUT 4182]